MLKNFQALVERLGELFFFGFQHTLDLPLLAFQLREGFAHLGHQRGDDLVEEGTLRAQLVAVTASAANDAAQHIATAFVGRRDAVSNQEAARANMVGNHFQRGLAFIGAADGLRCGIQQALEQVDLVVGVHMLQHGADALEAHAGIHRRRWQRVHHAIGGAVELHEHVVPDFDIAVAVFFWRAGRAAPDVFAMVEEDFGTRAARACVAHGPEVIRGIRRAFVVADTHHALCRDANFLRPDIIGFVIAGVDGDPELVFRQVQPLCAGEKLPRIVDGVTLEVVAKAEVTQHFKEGVVTCGITDVFQIVVLAASTHALLASGGTGVGAFFKA